MVVSSWGRGNPTLGWVSGARANTAWRVLAVGVFLWGVVAAEDRRHKVFVTRAAIWSVIAATEVFRADHGRCPATVNELVHPEVLGGTAGYLADPRLDGWGRPLRLTCPGWKHPNSVDVASGGASGTFLDLEQLE